VKAEICTSRKEAKKLLKKELKTQKKIHSKELIK